MKKRGQPSLTRREALALLGVGGCAACNFTGNPLRTIVDSITRSLIRSARAESSGAKLPPRNYFGIDITGGCFPYQFVPLNPFGTSSDVQPHPGVLNSFSPTTDDKAGPITYSEVTLTLGDTTINVPKIWGCNIPTSDGSSIPMSTLLQNTLFIRGVDMRAGTHDRNVASILLPDGSKPSLLGASADNSNAPIPAVFTGPLPLYSVPFASAKGLGVLWQYDGESSTILEDILAPFGGRNDGLSTSFIHQRQALQTAVDRALGSLAAFASSGQPGASVISDLRGRAENLLVQGVGNAHDQFATLYAKYQTLFARAADYRTEGIPGVTDKIVVSTNYADAHRKVMDGNSLLAMPDVRTMYDNFYVRHIVTGFAVAEALITSGYSTSIVHTFTGFPRMPTTYLNLSNEQVISTNFGGFDNDEHLMGALISVLTNSIMYRGLAACIYEFLSAMKSQGQFEETVVHLFSEFGRIPYNDGGGSDHGANHNAVTIFSGAIKSPMALGNIEISSTAPPSYSIPGTYGKAAPITIDGSRTTMGNEHVVSTVCQLLRIESPVSNFPSLVTETGSGIVATVDKAKNIA